VVVASSSHLHLAISEELYKSRLADFVLFLEKSQLSVIVIAPGVTLAVESRNDHVLLPAGNMHDVLFLLYSIDTLLNPYLPRLLDSSGPPALEDLIFNQLPLFLDLVSPVRLLCRNEDLEVLLVVLALRIVLSTALVVLVLPTCPHLAVV
jgi:hypothetical protein